MNRRLLLTAACAALVCGVGLAADLKSGPQAGERVKPFNPLNVTGADAGEARCQV
jgi:hypothetical protein